MLIRVLNETRPGDSRVALVPRSVATLTAAGHRVLFPAGAGRVAGLPDAAYGDAGAEVFAGPPPPADLVVAVGPVGLDEVLPAGAVIAFLDPLGRPAEMARLATAGVTALAMELIPRTTQAQAMDALSSQATAAGYQAVLLAASRLPRFLPMMMTAAGTVPPARVLVIGAGVAGLQAIATARRLGAVVAGYDIRPAAAEQVRSLGATFVGGPVETSAEATGGYAGQVDDDTRSRQLGRPGPARRRRRHRDHHRPGAGQAGPPPHHPGHGRGHAAGIGPGGPGRLHRGQLRGHRARRGGRCGRSAGDRAAATWLRAPPATPARCTPATSPLSSATWRRKAPWPSTPPTPSPPPPVSPTPGRSGPRRCGPLWRRRLMLDPVVIGVITFVLASFVGFEVITKVPPTLHTPLMSGSNAISGITIVGALIATGGGADTLATVLAFVAVATATVNVVGGFLVTDRMLGMFRKPRRPTGEETGEA